MHMYIKIGFLVAIIAILIFIKKIQEKLDGKTLIPEEQFMISLLGILIFILTIAAWPIVLISGMILGLYALISKM